jgi:predicted nucleic acid-binding protein
MITVIDANVLIALFKKQTSDDNGVRIEGFIEESRVARNRIIIPSPALSEFYAKAHPHELDFIFNNRVFQVSPFDAKAAIVCGEMLRIWADGLDGDKKDRHKAKFDMQIISIAKSIGADRIITNDKKLRTKAVKENINSIDISELQIPDSARQQKIQFNQ